MIDGNSLNKIYQMVEGKVLQSKILQSSNLITQELKLTPNNI